MKLLYLLTVLFFAFGILTAGTTFNDIDAGLPGIWESSANWGDYDHDGDLDVILTGKNISGDPITKLYRYDSGIFILVNTGIENLYNGSADWGDYDHDGDLDLVIAGSDGLTSISKIYRNDSGVFTDINAGLSGVQFSSVAWGDYDNDYDLDLLLTGEDDTYTKISKIYRNDLGVFTDINAVLIGVRCGSVAWSDYNNDGNLDFLLTGYTGSQNISAIYRNDGPGMFTNISAALPGVSDGSGTWGDYDKDGDPDILLTGYNGSIYISEIYRNDGSDVFTDISAGLTGVYLSSGEWGDYDKDRDPDILLTGYNGSQRISKIYKNTAGVFTDKNAGLTGVDDGSATWGDYDNDNDLDVLLTGWSGSTCISKIYRTDMDFNRIDSSITDVSNSSVDWGDYDNDGDLDVLLTGYSVTGPISKIYRNASGIFTDINAGLEGVRWGSSKWGDYDNDGDLDILLTGYSVNTPHYFSKIYRNDSGIFTDINAGLRGVSWSSAAWGDYDNDGDLDILLIGYTGSSPISKIYRNDNASFIEVMNLGLEPVYNGSVVWGDYDNDGDLDILLTGDDGSGYISKIYNNNLGIFTDINAGLTGVYCSSVAWGDYDNDGDLDILLTGDDGSGYISKIYNNNLGIFTDINAGLTGVYCSSVAWGDYDNDGDLDILLTGDNGSGYISKIYNNNFGVFTYVSASLTGVYCSSVVWGDYDNDGDLDILLTGYSDSGWISSIYKNNSAIKNTKPNPPSRIVAKIEGDKLKLSFNPATDAQTPQNGLSYNVNIKINGVNANSSMSSLTNGKRKIVSTGNASLNKFYYLNNFYTYLPQGEKIVSCKAQALDQCYEGSVFATSFDFEFASPRDLELSSKSEMIETDKLKWEYAYPEYVDYYVIQVDEDSKFGSPLEETIYYTKKGDSLIKDGQKIIYLSIALNSLTEFDSLVNNEKYYWRMKPVYFGINRFTVFTETPLSFIYKLDAKAPNPPVSGFNPSEDDIASNLPKLSWNVASDPNGHAEDLYYICQLDTAITFSTIQYTDTTSAGISSVEVSSALQESYRYYYRVKTIDIEGLQSGWSATQNFLTVMPPQHVKITDNGVNANLAWDAVPVNTKGVVYTVYISTDPYAVFPSGWTVAAAQLTANTWSEPHSATKKFYRITVGSSSK